MKEYLNWIVEKFISENFSCPECHLSFMLYDDIQELVLKYPDIISEKYSPEAYLKENEIKENKEISQTYGVFSKDIVSYLQTLTDLTESGNEIIKVESIRSVDGKDRYYIILYHKKEEE